MSLIEIHMIQNHSPANMNRDEQGAPKTCVFGGVMRNRQSSQSLKREIRNPGNPNDVHNPTPGCFATEMAAWMGARTKLFPWLVEQVLTSVKDRVPVEDHRQIVMAAQRIAVAKEKESKPETDRGGRRDNRPKTPQLVFLGEDEARRFVDAVIQMREALPSEYAYFLSAKAGFEEMIEEMLMQSGLPEKEKAQLVRASWLIAKCRMNLLSNGDEKAPDLAGDGDQPGRLHAEWIVQRLLQLRESGEEPDRKAYKDLTAKASTAEKGQVKEDSPKRPKKMDEFLERLKATLTGCSVDIALFGRMTTSDAFADVEAAMQVAHAISTHAVVNEVDYFTAVDDLAKGTVTAHLGEGQFVSPCLYKYFSLDWEQFVRNLAGPEPEAGRAAEHTAWRKREEAVKRVAAAALGHFLFAAAQVAPSGKQNGFAAHNEVAGILVEIKERKLPLSYANAFADPVRRMGDSPADSVDDMSLTGRSVAQFGDHVYSMRRALDSDSVALWYSPMTWKYPLRGWVRKEDGQKVKFVPVTDRVFDRLPDLIGAVVKEMGYEWNEVREAGKKPLET